MILDDISRALVKFITTILAAIAVLIAVPVAILAPRNAWILALGIIAGAWVFCLVIIFAVQRLLPR